MKATTKKRAAAASEPAAKPAPAKARIPARADGPVGREALLDAAVRQFSKAGYDSTTMRDIGALSGMLAGSIYYHFSSKEKLFLAVHEHAIDHIIAGVRRAVDPEADPWAQLTQAAQGYLEAMLKDYEYASIIITEFPRRRSVELRDQLISHRQRFEDVFTEIIKRLPLRKGVDRTYFRLGILGMLAWSYIWYRPDGPDNPKTIARKMVGLLKESSI